jgi:hypothetical protein
MTRSRARISGVVYLLYFVTVTVASLLVGRIPAAYSDSANLIANAVYVAVALLLYQILRPVSPAVALAALIVSVVGCVIQSLGLFHLVPGHSALPIFGIFNLTVGYLILRSTFLPRVIGALMALSGLGWLTFIVPALALRIVVPVEILGIVAEAALMLWLLVMGVNPQRWNERAAAPPRLRRSGLAGSPNPGKRPQTRGPSMDPIPTPPDVRASGTISHMDSTRTPW